MHRRIASFLIALFLRMLAILACGVVTLMLVDFGQDQLLPPASNLNISFDRLAWALGAAILIGLAVSVALIRWQSDRFTLTERIMLSCVATVLLPFALLAGNGSL